MVTKTAICRVLSTLEPVTMMMRNKRRAEGGISPDIENPIGGQFDLRGEFCASWRSLMLAGGWWRADPGDCGTPI